VLTEEDVVAVLERGDLAEGLHDAGRKLNDQISLISS
jgi:hypothetical protein